MVDMHIHTRASDGTDDILDLLQKIKDAGINTFSITDHDTIEGARDMEMEVPPDMTFIRGIEFSSITDAGKCHILGYGCDWNKREFRDLLEEGAEKRRDKLDRRLNFLREGFGIEFSGDTVRMLRMKGSVGKPHLGNLLVKEGYAKDKNSAIEKYISPCKTESDRMDGKKVIKAILSSGGVPVWAHPLGGSDEKEISVREFEKQLEVLMDAGLMGLECYYSKYTKDQIEMLVSVARKNNLYISGGSDYHGTNKTVQLGDLSASGLSINEDMLTVLNAIYETTKEMEHPLLEIIEGHDPGAYFQIMPIKVLDINKRTDALDNQQEMRDQLISVEEDIVSDFLHLIFRRHFDNTLPENAGRDAEYAPERYKDGIAFEWYLTDNFYTLEGMQEVADDIRNVARQLADDPDDESLDFMRKGLNELGHYIPRKGSDVFSMHENDIERLAAERIPDLIDFYDRFCGYLEQMIEAAKDHGYNLISVCGP